MPKSRRRARPKHKNKPVSPALSGLDKTLYILFIAVLVIGTVGIAVWMDGLTSRLAHANPGMIAWSGRGGIAAIAIVFPVILWGILAVFCLSERQPLFGRRDINYGLPWESKAYPLFMRKRQKLPPGNAAKSEIRLIGHLTKLLIAGTAVCLLVMPLGICPRAEIDTDHVITRYNAFNQPVRHCEMEAVREARFRIYYHVSRYGGSGWRCQLVAYTPDGREIFDADSFDSVAGMLAFKEALRPEIVTVSGAENLSRYLRTREGYFEAHPSELAALYALFEADR